MFLAAAKALTDQTDASDRVEAAIYLSLRRIRDCSHSVACATIRLPVADGHADEGVPTHLRETLRRAMWFPKYLPVRYEGRR